MSKKRKIIAIVLVIAILLYIAYAIYLLIIKTNDIYIVQQGTLSKEEEVVGYIIRDEVVIKENSENGIYAIAAECGKVAKDDDIFRYYSDNEKEVSNQINEINYKIQELLEQEKNPTSSADIKAIENQIETKVEAVNKLNNYQEIVEYKKEIDNLITKKINFIGEITENKEIKNLIKERKKCEETVTNSAEYVKAPISGVVSYRVDGLEEKLSVDNFNSITESYLEELDLKTGQIISTSSEYGKVIDNFKCYIAITMDSEEANSAKVGDTVQLRTSNKEENKAKIVQINDESGKRTIIFQVNRMTEELINHRKIAVDVIWWNKSGLKVPNQALIEENGLHYVIRNKAGIQTKLLVKIQKQTDKFSIISAYSTKELQELGYDEKEIRNYKKISNYDEIVLNQE